MEGPAIQLSSKVAQAEEKIMAIEGRIAHVRAQQTRLFREHGPGIAAREVEGMVASARAGDPSLTIEAATVAAYEARPDLYATIQGMVPVDASAPVPELERLITAAMQEDPALTYELACDAVLQRHPELYEL